MATIGGFGPFSHLRAESNQFVLHYKKGRLARQGVGQAYWFLKLSAAVAEVPVEDIDTTFLLRERTRDLQEVAVQCTVTYRVADPERAARRINFSVSLDSGEWKVQPLERLAELWTHRAQQPVRAFLTGVPLLEAVTSGAEELQLTLDRALRGDPELEQMGLALVGVQVTQVAPSAELAKALQTPTREALQQKADEAVFARRALAVEKERAIKENELASQIELARRQEELIRQDGSNRMLEVKNQAEAERASVEARLDREELTARANARDAVTRAEAEAQGKRLAAEATAEGEARRVEVWEKASQKVLVGLALQELAGRIDHIQHLNLTPDLLGQAVQRYVLGEEAS